MRSLQALVRKFSFGEAGQLQVAGGACLSLLGGRLVTARCDGRSTSWDATQDGQLKHGNVCLAASGSTQVAVSDCDEAAAEGADKFFPVAVPSHDPKQVVGVRSIGSLLQAAVKRQLSMLAALQREVPKLETCKVASLLGGARLQERLEAAKALAAQRSLAASGATADVKDAAATAVGMIAGHFGVRGSDLANVVAETTQLLAAAAAKGR
eukprot:gb/GFBE01010699.1/.p2 GENE.gb/GFBE01010699.1/~~gb/GFBE01010699.1/.p2  ORF type:complete len:210 (-),score=48.74 gb/GFBE01010699.1/:30-659(-)